MIVPLLNLKVLSAFITVDNLWAITIKVQLLPFQVYRSIIGFCLLSKSQLLHPLLIFLILYKKLSLLRGASLSPESETPFSPIRGSTLWVIQILNQLTQLFIAFTFIKSISSLSFAKQYFSILQNYLNRMFVGHNYNDLTISNILTFKNIII